MLFPCFVLSAILCNCEYLLYEFYMWRPRMINNDGFYHSEPSDHRKQYKGEMVQKFDITGT